MPGETSVPSDGVDLPVARVAVDMPLAHLDRLFDYAVPADLAAEAVAGARVRVRFAGRLVDGFVVERVADSEVPTLAPLHKVVSPEPVLAPEIVALARAVADRYAGTLADVLRLAVPPRHARVEVEPVREAAAAPPAPDAGGWRRYVGGPAYVEALTAGRAPRAVWRAVPDRTWPQDLAVAAAATLAGGRGVLIVVPDHRELARVDAALVGLLGDGSHVALTAELGPAERYRRWLAVRRGVVRCAIGTRSALLAPVADLGLVAVWDDGDDLHKEPRAPYPHVRDVLALRAHLAGAAALIAGFTPSVEADALVSRGWAAALVPDRATLRTSAPAVVAAGTDSELDRDPAARAARIPSVAWQAARAALAAGHPVLLQVPRAGYQPLLACDRCRAPARCRHCAGALARPSHGIAGCSLCGRPAGDWSCPACGARELRAVAAGSRRTAEELGRSFPGAVIRASDRETPVVSVGPEPVLVVATPGAEPVAEGGYAAVLLLDGGAMLARPDLRAGEEALRRWAVAASLCRSAADGGRVVVMADPALPVVQALLRWDPATYTEREARDRTELHFPPAARVATVDGPADAVADLLARAAPLPKGAEVLGPVPHGEGERAVVRVPWPQGNALSVRLKEGLGVRSAKKAEGVVRVELDPYL